MFCPFSCFIGLFSGSWEAQGAGCFTSRLFVTCVIRRSLITLRLPLGVISSLYSMTVALAGPLIFYFTFIVKLLLYNITCSK